MSAQRTRRKAAPAVRASEREGLKLDVKSFALRNLMTEQSRTSSGFATYYEGNQADLVRAGVPEYLFANHDRPVKFRVNGQGALLQRKGARYELTLHWDQRGPWYWSASHPALAEIARMIHITISDWLSTGEFGSDEVPVEKLGYHATADYHIPLDRRFRFAKGFRASLFPLTSELHQLIQNAEIMPLTERVAYEDPSDEETLSGVDEARATLARIGKRANGDTA